MQKVKNNNKKVGQAVQKIHNERVTDKMQPKFPMAFGAAMLIGQYAWFTASPIRGTLLPQLFSDIDPAHKVSAVAALTAVSAIFSALGNILFGALSDMTRTKIGRRMPWIIGGVLIESALLCLIANLTNIWLIVAFWSLVSMAENAAAAPMIAQQADRIAPKWRGTVSTLWGIGLAAQQLTTMLAAQFLGNVKLGIYILAAIGVVVMIAHVLLSHEKGNLSQPKIKFTGKNMMLHFSIPIKGARDYWLAISGKLLEAMAGNIVAVYLLYILTDYMHLGQNAAGKTISSYALITLIITLIFTAISGPIADKMGRLKLPVALSMILIGIGQFFPFFSPHPWTIYVLAVLAGIGIGIFNSIDNALDLAVLPNKETSGKDMGFINLANTLSQVMAALFASLIVTYLGGYRAIFPMTLLIDLIGGFLIFKIKSVK